MTRHPLDRPIGGPWTGECHCRRSFLEGNVTEYSWRLCGRKLSPACRANRVGGMLHGGGKWVVVAQVTRSVCDGIRISVLGCVYFESQNQVRFGFCTGNLSGLANLMESLLGVR